MKAVDPVCKMNVDIDAVKRNGLVSVKNQKSFYFCSASCKAEFDGVKFSASPEVWYKSKEFGNIFPYVLAFVLIVGTVFSVLFDFMLFYMGLFFALFSLFKMPEWKGFVVAFRQYDVIANFLPLYAWLYPPFEFVLGILYLVNFFFFDFYLRSLAWVTLIVMGIGALGVGLKLAKREKFQCACLGTWINVPLTKVTLLEDVLMAGMAVLILIGN